ncbi:hypothetical protein KCU88_g2747, partial [Aureobasidium melanogenum]
MTGLDPASPGEEPASSDIYSTQRTQQRTAEPAGNRRTKLPTALASQPSLNVPPSSSQGSSQNRGSRTPSGHPPSILPPEKVFPIQIGSDLFRLSGASISSDAPSYFTQFFEDQIRQNEETGGVRTLYIDRDPSTFRDVVRHLQGYYVKPVDGSHFVKLFADAQFYSLPRLIDQLFESEIYIQIGERHFQIPKDIFSDPGNSPNFFSLGFAVFFSSPGEVFPGLDRRGLLRPPSITPPAVPGRSGEIFAELLHLLRGYPLHVRNESHRAELLRDCRYFHLRGLEQKLIAHEISYNLQRQKHEICLRLEDVKPSGVSYKSDDDSASRDKSTATATTGGWVYYARPFVDDTSYEMVVEVGGESTLLDLAEMRAEFHGQTKARMASLFQVVANKMNLPTTAPLGLMMLSETGGSSSQSPAHTPLSSESRVKVRFEAATAITLDGERYDGEWDQNMQQEISVVGSGGQNNQPQLKTGPSSQLAPPPPPSRHSISTASQTSTSAPSAKKRKRQPSHGESTQWTIRTGQWRLRIQPVTQGNAGTGYEIVLVGVKIDAYSSEHARNARRAFLS